MEILIVDDEAEVCEAIERYITKYSSNQSGLKDLHIKKFTSVPFMFTYLENGMRPDVIFMDIKLNKYNGIEVAAKMQNIDAAITVVFITGYIEYSKDIFDAKPFDFLVKPIRQVNIDKVMDKIVLNEQKKERSIMAVYEKDAIYFIDKKDIIYVEAALKYTMIHTTERVYKTKTIFRSIELETEDLLIKCHRSYMINPMRIKRIDNLEIELTNGDIVPISRPKKKEVYNRLKLAINT